jgi:hypothetical protein
LLPPEGGEGGLIAPAKECMVLTFMPLYTCHATPQHVTPVHVTPLQPCEDSYGITSQVDMPASPTMGGQRSVACPVNESMNECLRPW